MVGEDFGIAHGFTQSMPFLGNPSKVGEIAFRIVQDTGIWLEMRRRGMAALISGKWIARKILEQIFLVLEVAAGEFLLELLDATSGIHEGLLAGEEWVGSVQFPQSSRGRWPTVMTCSPR